MKITAAHVEQMLQTLFELGERVHMAALPQPGIIMPGVEYEERYRVWIDPFGATLKLYDPALVPPDAQITYYEGSRKLCSEWAAQETMRLALEHVFGDERHLHLVPSEPRDSLPQTDEDPTAA